MVQMNLDNKLYFKTNTKLDRFSSVLLFGFIILSFFLFAYALTIPVTQRIRGDAYQYFSIAYKFHSIKDAVSYIGDRTYGYPLFLYLVKTILSPKSVPQWSIYVAYVQFIIHILSVLGFYKFFLQPLFQKEKISKIFCALTAGLIISYPTLVTNTSIALTDTFAIDLLLCLAILLNFTYTSKKSTLKLIFTFISGLLIGYLILVRPSYWPPFCIFYVALFVNLLFSSQNKFYATKQIALYLIGTALLILPVLSGVWKKYHVINLQNSEYANYYIENGFQNGLGSVRIFWSAKNATSTSVHPGIYDPYLMKTYYNRCAVKSVIEVGECLVSKPFSVPIYFLKKTIGLFDIPYLQSYTVDITPKWFVVWERIYGTIAFCGFISLALILLLKCFTAISLTWIGVEWTLFVGSLIGMHTLGGIEGRLGLPAVPFAIASLFLGYTNAKKLGSKYLIGWICLSLIFGCIFIFQIHFWDGVKPR